jgi:hypothetical protein
MRRVLKAGVVLGVVFSISMMVSLRAASLEEKTSWLDAFSASNKFAPISLPALPNSPITERDITLLVKTFGRPGCLQRLLRTVRARYPLLPIRVADDSSVPTSSNYSDVVVYHLPPRSGCAYGKNKLAQGVTTPYVIFMDDDMYPPPELDLIKWVERVRDLGVDLVSASVEDATYVPHRVIYPTVLYDIRHSLSSVHKFRSGAY